MSARILTVALALCAGCADRLPAKPELTSVDPGAARVLADQLVHLRGRNFAPRVQVDFATGRKAGVGEYSAHLLAPSGARIDLGQLALVSLTEATAVIPAAGVTEGTTYDVVLVDPWGGSSKLERGFHALAPCESADGTGPVIGTPCDGPDSDRCLDDVWECAGETPVCSTGANGCAPHVEVGWFMKPKSSVTLANPDQVVPHGLLDTPKALILWTGHDPSEGTYKGDYHLAVGLTDASRQSGAVGTLSMDAQAPGLAARDMAPRALSVVDYAVAAYVRAQASVTAWDASSFTLHWDTNTDDFETLVFYLAISGESVSSKLLSWQMPTSAGRFAVSGAGFQPGLVLHLHAGNQITAPPEMLTSSAFGFGAMTPTAQWATSFGSLDGFDPTRTFRVHRPNATVNMIVWNGAALATGKEAAFDSMDADGFTLNFTTMSTTYASAARSLALSGVAAHAGCVPKSTATTGLPAAQTVSGLPFKPQAVLLVGTHEASPPSVSSADAVYSFGALDAARATATALRDFSGLNGSRVESVSRQGAAYIKPRASAGTLAEAAPGPLTADGFTLQWDPNDGAADQLCYVAFGP